MVKWKAAMNTKGILIHYGELALKGKNRPVFERQLIRNIKSAILPVTTPSSKAKLLMRLYGRLFLKLPADYSPELLVQVTERLKMVFGIANFSPATLCDTRDPDTLKRIVWKEMQSQGEKFDTFRIRANRADKSFPLTSRDIEFQVGGFIKEQSGAQVNLEKADLTCFIELLSRNTLFYFEKIPGPGGLPTATAGKVVTLLSGGIDSPIAAWRIMKRGAKCVFVHCHSYPQTDAASQEKVKELARILGRWQLGAKLYLIPLLEIQKEIVAKCPTKLRVVLYRRMMLRLAERIAEKEKGKALVTGESLGQVASQTLENLAVTNTATRLPILRPLIGMDKQEIIEQARELGTYEISIQPHQDCCSLFVPAHPEIKARLSDVEKAEEVLDQKKLIAKALKQTTTSDQKETA